MRTLLIAASILLTVPVVAIADTGTSSGTAIVQKSTDHKTVKHKDCKGDKSCEQKQAAEAKDHAKSGHTTSQSAHSAAAHK